MMENDNSIMVAKNLAVYCSIGGGFAGYIVSRLTATPVTIAVGILAIGGGIVGLVIGLTRPRQPAPTVWRKADATAVLISLVLSAVGVVIALALLAMKPNVYILFLLVMFITVFAHRMAPERWKVAVLLSGIAILGLVGLIGGIAVRDPIQIAIGIVCLGAAVAGAVRQHGRMIHST
jgi:drug/metabolite transporter (DMT)-like permease